MVRKESRAKAHAVNKVISGLASVQRPRHTAHNRKMAF